MLEFQDSAGRSPLKVNFKIGNELFFMHLPSTGMTAHAIMTVWEREWGITDAGTIRFEAPPMSGNWLNPFGDAVPVHPGAVRLDGHHTILKALASALKERGVAQRVGLGPVKRTAYQQRTVRDRPVAGGYQLFAPAKVQGSDKGPATSLLGTPLVEQTDLERIRARFADYGGPEPPEDAAYWTEAELEAFFKSSGERLPDHLAAGRNGAQKDSCPLLSRLRVELAKQKIEEATPGYLSFCRYLKARGDFNKLPGAAGCTPVARAAIAPEVLTSPLVVKSFVKNLTRWGWNLDFWKHHFGDVNWMSRAVSPMFEQDTDTGVDAVSIESTIAEYVDYARVVHEMDPRCDEDKALAFPRVSLESCSIFSIPARHLYNDCWEGLSPPGVKDQSAKWVRWFAERAGGYEWTDYHAKYYKIDITATGAMSRLRTENHGAHVWFAQTQGKRVFYLFTPKQASAVLYATSGDAIPHQRTTGLDFTLTASPVDIFRPSREQHPRFAEAAAQSVTLLPGECLIVPSGWWYCSVALEPSVTVRHPFWNQENKRHIHGSFADFYQWSEMDEEDVLQARSLVESLHEQLMRDEDSD